MEDKRHVEHFLIQGIPVADGAMIEELFAVVRDDYQDCIIEMAGALEPFEARAKACEELPLRCGRHFDPERADARAPGISCDERRHARYRIGVEYEERVVVILFVVAQAENDDDVARPVLVALLVEGREELVAQLEANLLRLGFLGEMALDWAFGDVWSRPGLSRRDRSMVVVSVLAALNLTHELESHVQGALNHGVTRQEIEEIMITLAGYGGFPRAIDGMRSARKVFERATPRS